MPKFIKRHQRSIDHSVYKNKSVFGVPFKVNFQRHGQPLPQAIIQIMKYLRKNSLNTVGIFRKSGSRLRMSSLREKIESNSTTAYSSFIEFERELIKLSGSGSSGGTSGGVGSPNIATSSINNDLNSIGSGFSSQSTSKSDLIDDINSNSSTDKYSPNVESLSIDLADILKQYFRELPECLLTNKVSQMLIDIFICKSNEKKKKKKIRIIIVKCLFYFILFFKSNLI
jgi:hypothetical protein